MKKLSTWILLSCVLLSMTPMLSAQSALAVRTLSPDVEKRVDEILSKLTLEEKIDMIGGTEGFYIRAIPRLNLPALKMADGPIGVRNYGPATTMAGGISLAASWNPSLAERAGTEIGRDARAKGVHFLLGPGVNIYRAPMNGRNFEYFGEDPFLSSRIAVGYINGVQSQGVSATVKHFMGNNSEFDRHNSDAIIDERTMREIYLPVFEAAVKEAHVGAIMDSYNLTNGTHLTQNDYLNTDVAKKDWGFDGIMMSDWSATYDGVAAANGGLDLEMPSGAYMNRQNLLPAVQSGKVSQATIDDKIRRILRTAIRFGWLDRDQTDLSIPRYNQIGRQVALQAAREGMVLLKNDGGVLPLDKKKTKSILVVGPDAYPAVPVGGGSAGVRPFSAVSFLEGLSDRLGTAAQVQYARGIPTLAELAESTSYQTAAENGKSGLSAEYFKEDNFKGTPETRVDQHLNFGQPARITFPPQTLSSRWTGYYIPKEAGTFEVFVQSTGEAGGHYRLKIDDNVILDNWDISRALTDTVTMPFSAAPHKVVLEQHGRPGFLGSRLKLGIVRHGSVVEEQAKKLAASADVVVVAAGFDPETESEGADRSFRLPPGQDELIQQMAASNKNTVVVLTSGGNVDMNTWVGHVPAIVEAWYPGQEGGTALAEILLGDVNPSGKLPVTFEKSWSDNPTHDSYYPSPQTKKVEYKEGVFVGYRGYEHAGVKPQFPFGFGMSYTTFKLDHLTTKKTGTNTFEVSFEVKNTGNRAGADVAELYVGDTHSKTARPAKELKGFAKVDLRPGESKKVTIPLDARAFSYYDVSSKGWHIEAGDFDILVGHSSEDIELKGKVTAEGK